VSVFSHVSTILLEKLEDQLRVAVMSGDFLSTKRLGGGISDIYLFQAISKSWVVLRCIDLWQDI